MKKTLLLGVAGLITLVSYVKGSSADRHVSGLCLIPSVSIDVPPAVKTTISRLYPGVKQVKWEKENGNYEASLKHNGKALSLVMDATGTVLETETSIAVSALPTTIRDYVAKHYAGKKIKEAAEILDAKGNKTYEAEVGGKDLIFDTKGTLIKG